jgi:hypothetical protein
MRRMGRRLVAGGLVALAMASTAPAGAKPVFKERFHDVSSEVIEGFCGVTVRANIDIRGSASGNPHGPDGLVYFADHVHGRVVWTNLETNKSFTEVDNFLVKDQRVTDNGDGTLTIRIKATGSVKFYGADGKLLFNDPGQTQFEILVDHGGTPQNPEDDEFLEELGIVKGSTGRNDTAGRDFCEDFLEFTG